jgi:hypothetical protein
MGKGPRMIRRKLASCVSFALASIGLAAPAYAGQPLETETARLPAQGHGNLQLVAEAQTSPTGKETAVPLAVEFGITDRLEIAVEPVVFTSIRPKTGPSARGFGDTEVTLTYLLSRESSSLPAFAIAGEVKFPTTKNPLIGTGGTDFRVVGIASKSFGPLDVHANLGYTFTGRHAGTKFGNVFDYAVAVEYSIAPRFSLMAEVLGTVSTGKESLAGPGQEAAATSVTGLVGAEYRPSNWLGLAIGITYDSDKATLLRSAVTIRF